MVSQPGKGPIPAGSAHEGKEKDVTKKNYCIYI